MSGLPRHTEANCVRQLCPCLPGEPGLAPYGTLYNDINHMTQGIEIKIPAAPGTDTCDVDWPTAPPQPRGRPFIANSWPALAALARSSNDCSQKIQVRSLKETPRKVPVTCRGQMGIGKARVTDRRIGLGGLDAMRLTRHFCITRLAIKGSAPSSHRQ